MSNEFKYVEFTEWFDEHEMYGMRSERFFEEVKSYSNGSKECADRMRHWLKAAFECGRMKADNK